MTFRYVLRRAGGEPFEIAAPTRPRAFAEAVALARSTGARIEVLRRPRHPHPELGRPDRLEKVTTVWIGPRGGVCVSGASAPSGAYPTGSAPTSAHGASGSPRPAVPEQGGSLASLNKLQESSMDLTVDQAGFARALRLIGRAVPSRPTLPILQHVLLEAAPGRLTLTATDLDLAVVTSTPADVTEPGRVLLPARLLGEYVGQLPSAPLRLSFDAAKHRVKASCGGFVANVATASPDEFPALPPTEGSTAIELDGGRLRAAIGRAAFAAAADAQRPVLTGVLFDFGAEGLTLAAADGFRLARARLPEVTAEPCRVLVPARAVDEFGRLLGEDQPARLVVLADGRGMRLEVGETTAFARLIEGTFPNYEQIIPRESTTRVHVDAAAFRQAVRVAGLFGGSGDVRPVRLEAAPDRLRLRARGDQTGEAEGELPASLEGTPQAVVLNTRLLTDALEAASGQRLEIAWSSPRAPVVVREAGNEAGDLTVVMPLFDAALLAQDTAPAPEPEPVEEEKAA